MEDYRLGKFTLSNDMQNYHYKIDTRIAPKVYRHVLSYA